MTTLQERIAELMQATGLTVGEMAEIAGVTSPAVSQWVSGPTKTLKTGPATKLADRTGFRAQWIANGEGPKRETAANDAGAPPAAARGDLITLEQAIRAIDAALEPLGGDDRLEAANILANLAKPGRASSVALMFSGSIAALSSKRRAA